MKRKSWGGSSQRIVLEKNSQAKKGETLNEPSSFDKLGCPSKVFSPLRGSLHASEQTTGDLRLLNPSIL